VALIGMGRAGTADVIRKPRSQPSRTAVSTHWRRAAAAGDRALMTAPKLILLDAGMTLLVVE
jgi:hypothetical protein